MRTMKTVAIPPMPPVLDDGGVLIVVIGDCVGGVSCSCSVSGWISGTGSVIGSGTV